MGNTIFKRINIESFGGIDSQSPLTIVFGDDYNGATLLTGDEATGKTSAITALEALLGEKFSEYYVNAKSKTVKGECEFEVDGTKYRTRITKTSFKLEQWTKVADKEKWISPGEDKALIRKLLPFASDPSILIQKDGKAQIEWIKGIAGSNADDTDLKAKYDEQYKKRTLVNRDIENYKRQLIESSGFEYIGKDIGPTEDFQTLQNNVMTTDFDKVIGLKSEQVQSLKTKVEDINDKKTKFNNFDVKIQDRENEIQQLLDQIEQKKALIKEYEEQKTKGIKFFEDNKDIPNQLKIAEDELNQIKESKLQKNFVENTNKAYKDYKLSFDAALLLTSEIDELQSKRLAVAKSLTPDIEGFEVKLGEIVDGEEMKGLYYNGINIASLSESERYGLCMKIWAHYKIKIVFIENISSLGSNAIEIINDFIKNNGIVFATSMKRYQEKMSVQFSLTEIKTQNPE